MKKNWLRNSLSLLLVGGMLLSALPVGAAGTGMDDETTQFPAGEKPPIVVDPSYDETPILPVNPGTSSATVLYSWAASDLNRDIKAFSSNLPDNSDPRQRWNEVASLYTGQESRKVSMHSFLNAAEDTYGLKTTKDLYGRTVVENLQVDVYPMAQISDAAVVSLGLVYAHKPSEHGLNPANNGLLQVYVSDDGENWSEDFAKVCSARIVGNGVDEKGEDVIYYEIFTEDLKAIAEGNINALRIMPDGKSGMCGGSFSLCSLSLNAYKTESAFNKAVPKETEGTKADRTAVLNAYSSTAESSGLARAQAAMALVTRIEVAEVKDMLNTMGLRFADGVEVRATADVLQIFDWMRTYNLRSEESIQSILSDYEEITSTEKVIKDLNRPQQIFKAYATCDVGDLLVKLKKDGTSNVYMVAEKVSAQPDKAGNIDIETSKVTYVDNNGQTYKDAKLFDLYKQGFVPMVMDALADDMVQPVRVDSHISVADSVRVAVSSNYDVEKIVFSMEDFSAVVTEPDTAGVYTNTELDAFVDGLEPGKYKLTAQVYTGLNQTTPVKHELVFEVREKVEEHIKLNTDNMTLGNSLALNFWVYKSQMRADLDYTAKLVRTFEDGDRETVTIPMSEWVACSNTQFGDYYQIVYSNFAAKEMTDEVSVVILVDGVEVSNTFTDTIRDYAEFMLNYGNNTEEKIALVDMLNYGAAAQKEFGYKTDDLANAGLTEEQQALATPSVENTDNWHQEGAYAYASNLELADNIILRLWFKDVTEDMYAKVSFEDHYGREVTTTVGYDEFYCHNAGNKTYSVPVDELVIADGNQVVTCELYNGSGERLATITESVASYLSFKISNNEDTVGLFGAALKFVNSAYNMFH